MKKLIMNYSLFLMATWFIPLTNNKETNYELFSSFGGNLVDSFNKQQRNYSLSFGGNLIDFFNNKEKLIMNYSLFFGGDLVDSFNNKEIIINFF
jgi:hypothetical protein